MNNKPRRRPLRRKTVSKKQADESLQRWAAKQEADASAAGEALKKALVAYLETESDGEPLGDFSRRIW